MRWQGGRRSGNVEDRRSMRLGGAGLGLGGLAVLLVAYLLGADPTQLLQLVGGAGGGEAAAGPPLDPDAPTDAAADFARVVLADTEDVWNGVFAAEGQDYQEPTLVLFRDAVSSRCGMQSAAVGPFYCPADANVYLDLGFFDELARRHGAPGDFAAAYVIAHEVGHHVQNLLGISDSVNARMRGASEAEANDLSVRLELQADCLAGVWAHHADRMRSVLEPGDVEEALQAAAAIGDDRLQREAQGYVVPDSFTHGTSEQRVRWFKRGLEGGTLDAADTFSARDL
jgi:predicted metalloprotease